MGSLRPFSGDTKFCLCPPRLESQFPPVLWKSYNQIPPALKTRFPGDFQFLYWISRLGSLTWGSEPSELWENLFCIIAFQSLGPPLGGYGIWFFCDCTPLLPSRCSFFFVFGHGVSFFLVGFSILLLMAVQQPVEILVLSQEEMSARPSIPPSWTGILCYKIFIKTFYFWNLAGYYVFWYGLWIPETLSRGL